MRTTNTVCVSLESGFLQILDRLARELGSRSAAIRMLLQEHERLRSSRRMEDQYRAYFQNEGAALGERRLTEEMLHTLSRPDSPTPKKGLRHEDRRSPSRKRALARHLASRRPERQRKT